MIAQRETRGHKERIGEADRRRKTEQSSHEDEDLLQGKWVNTDEEHSEYDYYQQRACQTPPMDPSHAVVFQSGEH